MAKYYPKIIFVLLLVFALTSQVVIYAKSKSLQATNSAFSLKQVDVVITQLNSGVPLRVKIPSINVNAIVESVGITSEGLMGVPQKPDNVAWFNLGPRPGENGNAVIDGHSGWKNNRPAVFDNLSKLQKGDKIYVEDDKGTTIIFIVHNIQSYNPQADASSVFNSYDGKAHLNLITCSGLWDELSQSHNERLVIFADKVLN